ncbi:DUF4932 domain-containing protein [Mucilaginibacter galii]|uniref:DUF4932 domain-containing protein n=1 Tax=Mucilaginibacter galii TaxID=2005073 RepID=A0A917JAL3_9SPHI|nr:DUF4932 domain-containing protein [Mucilaginibacter galii]GGI50940.1 hypothetical protein GCM10011425_21520 [Mucilaginibacter galii]
MKRTFTLATLCIIAAASLFTSCKSYDVASRFNSKYVIASSGKMNAEVPENFELGYAMLALTNLAQKDTAIVDQNTAYYHDLMTWMGKYKNHKSVELLNATLSRNPKLVKSYLDGLYAFQMNGNRFSLKSSYRIDLNRVDFKRFAILLEKFHKDSRFHEFYVQHNGLYADMIQKANNLYSFNEAKTVNGTVKGYQVILSPLTKGYAGTMEIKGHAYSELIIFPRMSVNGRYYAMKEAIAGNRSAE